MEKVKVYLDHCCFNRPYDDQTQPRIQFESAAKLMIQSLIVAKKITFAWSYINEFENTKNPFPERQDTILSFKQFASEIIPPNQGIESIAKEWQRKGLKTYDSLHIACAIHAGCDYFLTVDDKVLKKRSEEIKIADPVIFINHLLKEGRTP